MVSTPLILGGGVTPSVEDALPCTSNVPPLNLTSFFRLLATGEDVDGLIHRLRLTAEMGLAELAISPQLRGSSRSKDSSTIRPRYRRRSTPHHADTSTMKANAPTRPTPVPSSLMWRRAVSAALLFSTESPRAGEEATRLYYTPHLQAIIRPVNSPRVELSKGGSIPLPLLSLQKPVVPHTGYQTLLSESVVVAMARDAFRTHRDASAALRLLQDADPTPAVQATRLEYYGVAGMWEEAAEALRNIPRHQRTECDVNSTIRAYYVAARAKPGTTFSRPPCAGHPAARSPATASPVVLILLQAVADGVPFSTPSALNDALGYLCVTKSLWEEACQIVNAVFPSRLGNAPAVDDTPRHQPADAQRLPLQGAEDCSPVVTTVPRPNAVTIYQLCSALKKRPAVAVRYVSHLIDAYKIPLSHDPAATIEYLWCCVRSGSTPEALRCLLRHHLVRSAPSAPPPLDFLPMTLHLSLLILLRNASSLPPLYAHAAAALLPSSQVLSRYYSADTLSRAYNSMIQQSPTLATAQQCYEAFEQSFPHTDLLAERLENESIAHLSTLHGMHGSWQEALRLAQALLHDPRRRAYYLPTAALHDTVQYALWRAPSPGPSWETSVQLFMDMCDRAQVPLSTVAFQCTTKKCLAHHAEAAAHSLLQYVLRRGIHR